MQVRRNNIARYRQKFDSEELEDFDDEEKRRPKKKETKDIFETYRRSVYCLNCYNEGHLTKEYTLLNKFCQICKRNDHNTYQCPNEVMVRICPSREIVPMHVVQVETLVVQEQKQLHEYNTPNNQFGNQQYNSRPNGQNWRGID